MAEKLHATVEQAGDTSVVKLAGFLDENNNLKKLVSKIPAGTAEIDLGGVERINSVGIRDWVNWLAALDANGTRTVLVACSPAIVAQINLVKNFAGNGAVKSFQVPFHCRECDEEKIVIVETAEMSEPGSRPPSCPCPACERAMDIDEMPESYFAFLGTASVPDADADLARGSAAVVKSRVKTRERKSAPPERQSRPSLSAFQTPANGTKRPSVNPLLAKRPSQQKIGLGSSERISGPKISGVQINTPRPSAPTVSSKSHVLMLLAIVVLLLTGIGALGYIVFMQ